MKYFYAAMLSTILLITAVETFAQSGVWVICKSMQTGHTQAFEGSCPRGWVFIRYA